MSTLSRIFLTVLFSVYGTFLAKIRVIYFGNPSFSLRSISRNMLSIYFVVQTVPTHVVSSHRLQVVFPLTWVLLTQSAASQEGTSGCDLQGADTEGRCVT
jgi:hypothetical protein